MNSRTRDGKVASSLRSGRTLLRAIATRIMSFYTALILPGFIPAHPRAYAPFVDGGVSEDDILTARKNYSSYALISLLLMIVGLVSAFLALYGFLPSSDPTINIVSQWARRILTSKQYIIAAVPIATICALYLATRGPQERLLKNFILCARYLDEMYSSAEISPLREAIFRRLQQRKYRIKRFSGLAWSINRDCKLMQGVPRSTITGHNVTGVGQVLLWLADNPRDRKRRAVAIEHLSQLLRFAISGDSADLESIHVPSSRYRVSSSRRRAASKFGELITGTLTTGVILAVITALLKIWIK